MRFPSSISPRGVVAGVTYLHLHSTFGLPTQDLNLGVFLFDPTLYLWVLTPCLLAWLHYHSWKSRTGKKIKMKIKTARLTACFDFLLITSNKKLFQITAPILCELYTIKWHKFLSEWLVHHFQCKWKNTSNAFLKHSFLNDIGLRWPQTKQMTFCLKGSTVNTRLDSTGKWKFLSLKSLTLCSIIKKDILLKYEHLEYMWALYKNNHHLLQTLMQGWAESPARWRNIAPENRPASGHTLQKWDSLGTSRSQWIRPYPGCIQWLKHVFPQAGRGGDN